MPLTGVDKVKLTKYFKEHAIDDLYYYEMCDYLGKRGKIKDFEFLDYFTDCVINEFSKDVKISIKHVAKLISWIGNFVGWMHEEGSTVSDETLDKIRSFDQLYNEYLISGGFFKIPIIGPDDNLGKFYIDLKAGTLSNHMPELEYDYYYF